MDLGVPNVKGPDLEVTGVSRSGRVCKKSSKLTDFQSPDDIETKLRKQAMRAQGRANQAALFTNIKQEEDLDIPDDSHTDSPYFKDDFNESNGESSDGDMENDDNTADDKSESDLVIDTAPKRSIYMTEKSSKYKKILKDGKVVIGKAQRKDKGKRRFTAYMLWAKDVRKQMLNNPDMDFGTISKKLGEMWANVPSNQKYNWKRRAKRIANKFKNNKDNAFSAPFVQKYLHLNKAPTATAPSTPSSSRGRKQVSRVPKEEPQSQMSPEVKSPTTVQSPTHHKLSLPGISPTDVAAHLKLLGDSLTIIGERLKEHEGQIAVSGSLSVLLDSLLCSIGPLMCLTTQIPGLEANTEHLKDLLQNTLDNIAFVMPGL